MTQTITWVIWVAAIAVAMYAAFIRRNNWVILAMMAVLVAASVYWIVPPSTKTKLGLDLQGGLQVVYTAKTATGEQPTSKQLDQTVTILDKRVNSLGVTESQIQRQGTDQISVALPGITDVQEALDKIGKTAQLRVLQGRRHLAAGRTGREQGGGSQGAQAPGRQAPRDRRAVRRRAPPTSTPW